MSPRRPEEGSLMSEHAASAQINSNKDEILALLGFWEVKKRAEEYPELIRLLQSISMQIRLWRGSGKPDLHSFVLIQESIIAALAKHGR